MAIIAKGQKTITGLQDGYSIIATPSNIVVPTNADGSGSNLSGAKCRVILQNSLGVSLPVNISAITATGCTATFSNNEATISAVSADSGNLAISFSSGSYSGSINVPFSKLKQGESSYNVLLSNEAHALPALYNGNVEQSAIDLAVSRIAVFKGAVPLTPVAANATPTLGQYRYNIDSVVGGTAVRVKDVYNNDLNNTFKLATITASTCIIKVKISIEGLSNVVEKEMSITKVVGGDPTDFNELKSVFDDWKYAGTNEFDGNKIKSGTISVDKLITLYLIARQFATDNLPSALTINKDGNGLFEVPYPNGNIAIQIGMIQGKPQIIFYDEAGVKTWSQDKNGVLYVDSIPETWTNYNLTFFTSTNAPDVHGNITEAQRLVLRDYAEGILTMNHDLTECIVVPGIERYIYAAGRNEYSANNKYYEGWHVDRSYLGAWIPNGWYAYSGQSAAEGSAPKRYDLDIFYISNGQERSSQIIRDIRVE